MRVSPSSYLGVAIPFILSTITQPLLGAADTAVVGRLGDPACIAGVSIGAVIFNTLYWLFGFLRVGTTALSAQAGGMGESERVAAGVCALIRPGLFALSASVLLLSFQDPIFRASMRLISPDAEVARLASVYYRILIWGAPLVLANYVTLGWLMGQRRIAVSLIMQIGGNLLNIVLDLLFVYGFHMEVAGVAAATLLSQGASFAVGAIAVLRYCGFRREACRDILKISAFAAMARENLDLLLRTLCLLIQINLFTIAGAAMGTDTLSANAILYQIMMVMSYSFDGLANASSVFAGGAKGRGDATLLAGTWRETLRFSFVGAGLWFLTCLLLRERIVALFTDIPAILGILDALTPWLCVFPLLACVGVAFYGIFTGLGYTAPIRNSTAASLLLFLFCREVFVPLWGNNGLWLSFMSFYFGRSVFLLPYCRSSYRLAEV